jgi:hypothetical protein
VDNSSLFQQIDSFLKIAEKVFGPYDVGKVGRKIVIVIDDDGNRRTVSYPKYLMEQHLGRKLDPDQCTIDHWDSNVLNNDLSNLRIVPRDQHSANDTRRVRLLDLECANCGEGFQRSPRLVRDKSKKGKVSAFCSKSCAGKYSRDVQLGNREKLPVPKPPASEYYKRKYESVEAVANYFTIKYGI